MLAGRRAPHLPAGEALGIDATISGTIPTAAGAGEDLEAPDSSSAGIITWHRYSTSDLHPIRARRIGAALQARKVGLRPRLPSIIAIAAKVGVAKSSGSRSA